MGRSGDKASSVSVSYRRADDLSEVAREWTAAGIDELANAAPWRTFRWHRGQKHYSGTYWSSTIGNHIIYESRLELARLLFADFDTSVQNIVAQPFLLRASVDRKLRKHVPDFLLVTNTGPVVVGCPSCKIGIARCLINMHDKHPVLHVAEWLAGLVDGEDRRQSFRKKVNETRGDVRVVNLK